MKASDKPQISSKWWSSEKPDDVEGKDLKKALAEAEKALEEADKRGDADSIDAAIGQLQTVAAAANKTIKKECDKKKHKDLIAVLEKFDRLVADEVARLEEAQTAQSSEGGDGEAEEDEEEKGVLKPEYLQRMIKQLRSGNELNFCFGLNRSTPEDSRLVLCNKRQPDRLFKILKRTGDFSNRLLTYGTATGDGKVLQFRLSDDAKEPSQIAKLAKLFLKGNRELKYKKLRVLAGGQTFEEDMPDVEGNNLEQELAKLQNLVAAWRDTLRNVAGQIDNLRKSIDGQNDPALRTVSEGLSNVMNQFPDLDLSKLVAAAQSNDRAAYDQTLSQTAKELREVHDLLAKGPLLSTIDENPFVDTNVHATVNSTLERISSELGVSA